MRLFQLLSVIGITVVSACGKPPSLLDGGLPTGGGSGGGSAGTVTWYKDVQPIVQQHCSACHVAGGIAPFALDNYALAFPQAPAMAAAVSARQMPPWMPSDTCGGPFVGDRRLSEQAIDTLVNWSAAGAPKGDIADAPLPPDGGPSGLARVDQTLTMTEAYTPSAALSDDYRCFLLNPQLTSPRQVIGYDIQPGVRAEVHHVIVFIADAATAQAKDATEAGPGWTCFGEAGVPSTGAVGAWAPGMPAVTFPANTGITLQPGQALVMQVHYNTSAGTRSADRTSIQLAYSATTITDAYMLELVASGFSIPPNSTGYSFSRSFANPYGRSINVYGYLPHMHTRGKRISIKGPGNACLLEIPQWDFHWQQQYFTAAPFVLADGAALTLECTWDNPTSATIRWGEKTTDEMCFAFLYATP